MAENEERRDEASRADIPEAEDQREKIVGEVSPESEAEGRPEPPVERPGLAVDATGSREPEPGPATVGGMTLLLAGLIALIFGGVGAWVYETYLAERLHPERTAPTRSASEDEDEEREAESERLRSLAGRIEELDRKVDGLGQQAETDELATSDLDPLRSKVSQIDELSKRLDDLSRKVEGLPERVETNQDRIASNAEALESMRTRLAGLETSGESSEAGRSTPELDGGARGAPTRPGESGRRVTPARAVSPQPDEDADAALARGVELFQNRDYAQARDVFLDAVESEPDDARLWYYAALANGFATRDWRGETERLVKEGIEREKSGTPSKEAIDAAFSDLTTRTGKDWLAAYRRRAR